MGPSGSGKTTLLSILGCMARPTAGRIRLGERELTSLPERFLTEIRCKTFGFIFQQFNLIRGITALENVMLPAYPGGERRPVLQRRAMDLLAMFDLTPKASAHVEWLSGGEAQRMAIARALINDPSVIIADEPTAHLDTKLSAEFLQIVQRLKAEGKTVLIASHDPLVRDANITDRVVQMRDGKIVLPGGGCTVIFHPGVLALLLDSILTSGLLVYASAQGIGILRDLHFDDSGLYRTHFSWPTDRRLRLE